MDAQHEHCYTIKQIGGPEKSDDIWKQVEMLDAFKQPWKDGALQKTHFRAFHDNKWLYIRYDVEDTTAWIFERDNNKMEVALSNRVEIFFKTDELLEKYYCLEIDSRGRVLDYSASFYRNFDYTWLWPKGQLCVQTELTDKGYKVDLRLGMESLKNLGILKNRAIKAGIFRGDCIDLGSPKGDNTEFNWISWVDPKTEKPDFHVGSAFGTLKLA